ncbi:TetR/AcrR family transcriptional regulator [Arthrobacter sp. ISL-28]|uniref:TetR/AcrR family transcriptional regulator n=1 Tax=Arthrobacter sp. ISL-28 TaxID=2819108 RepID=UPI001BE6996F|nr:TetR family transcriptional regulator [Arthrobacter sp. ISL-28]MBT2521750.1 TetR/AcrR family transcriptional regulator [Arthrobacter sp. ISL-28]
MAGQKLRKDAARNRELLLKAGREVFARHGLDATLNDVAHYAGVGVGTAYRRFANKEELLDAIRVQQVDEIEEILHQALAVEDPWEGLVLYMEKALALNTSDRGMAQILAGRRTRAELYDASRDRIAPLVNEIAGRARLAGAIREEITGTDLVFIQIACTSVATVVQDGPDVEGRSDVEELYRRYLWIMLDGLRPHREGIAPLPVAALTTEQTHALLRSPLAPEGEEASA